MIFTKYKNYYFRNFHISKFNFGEMAKMNQHGHLLVNLTQL